MNYSIQQKNNYISRINFAANTTVNKPQKTDFSYANDILTLATQEAKPQKNKSMPNWLKYGVIPTALVGIGVLAYILTKGKIQTKQVKQLAEHIDFKEATSIEEAMNFGKIHLGIEQYKGFEDGDLEVINWINEGFVRVSNKLKGKAVMPDIVDYTTRNRVGWGTKGFWQSASADKRVYKVNKNVYGNIDNEIRELLSSIVSVDEKGITSFKVANCSDDDLMDIVIKTSSYENGHIKSFKGKVEFLNNLYDYGTSVVLKTEYKPVSAFSFNYHECGHLLDEYLARHAGQAVDKNIADLISFRAKDDQAEMVAEWFRKYMEGINIAPEATEYVKKLGGIPVEELV